MIYFEGTIYNLKYKEDRQALSDKVYKSMKKKNIEDFNHNFNKLKTVIISGDESKLSQKKKLYKKEYGLEFMYVKEENVLENALISEGYDCDKSWSSKSIYVTNDSNERVRISNHSRAKRKYGFEEKCLTFGTGIIKGIDLIKNGFSNLNPDKRYFLY